MQRYTAIRAGTIGLFKTEAVGRGSPFLTGPLRTIDDRSEEHTSELQSPA